jgi:hypothetical protein
VKFKFEVKGRAALREAIETAAMVECKALNFPEAETKALVKARTKTALDACKFWSADGTTFTIAIDTDAATCEVVAC